MKLNSAKSGKRKRRSQLRHLQSQFQLLKKTNQRKKKHQKKEKLQKTVKHQKKVKLQKRVKRKKKKLKLRLVQLNHQPLFNQSKNTKLK